MFFIHNKALVAGSMLTCFGPYETAAQAIAAAEQIGRPGEYAVYGPATMVHQVTIAAPVVTSAPIAPQV